MYGTHKFQLNLRLLRWFDWNFTVANVHVAILDADFLSHYNLLVDFQCHQLIDAFTGRTSNGYIALKPVHSISEASHANSLARNLTITYTVLQEFVNFI